MLLTKPIPSTVRKTAIRKMLGSARPTIDVPIAIVEPRWKWPSTIPSGSATRSAEAERGARELELLERLRREEPGMVADEAEGVDERMRVGGVEDQRVPTDERLSRGDEDEVERERERDDEHAGRVDLGLERRRQPEREEDRVAEAAVADERGDRRDRDRRDDRDPEAADDRRQRERQLDARQHLAASKAHPARGLEHLGRRRAEAGDDVRVEDHERVADERDHDRRRGEAGEGDEDLEGARLGIV